MSTEGYWTIELIVLADAREETRRFHRAFLLAAVFVGLLWLIELAVLLFHLDLAEFSIFPRRLATLPGIALAPLLHGSVFHLFTNMAPILVLGSLLIYGYPKAARILLPSVYFGSGLGVWLFARPAWHLGSSGLIFGILFFLLTIGILRWDRRAIALALVVFLLYGSMIWGVLPTAPGISFEYHLFGAGIGVLLAFLLKGLDPPASRKKYSWEEENPEDDWPSFEQTGGVKEEMRVSTLPRLCARCSAAISNLTAGDQEPRSGICWRLAMRLLHNRAA